MRQRVGAAAGDGQKVLLLGAADGDLRNHLPVVAEICLRRGVEIGKVLRALFPVSAGIGDSLMLALKPLEDVVGRDAGGRVREASADLFDGGQVPSVGISYGKKVSMIAGSAAGLPPPRDGFAAFPRKK